MREWWSAADLAREALPALPETERGIAMLADRRGWLAPEHEGHRWRPRIGRGGGVEFHVNVLPLEARLKLIVQAAPVAVAAAPARKAAKQQFASQEMWAWLDRQPDSRRAAAQARLETLTMVEALAQGGTARSTSFALVAEAKGIPLRTLYDWAKLVEYVDRADWLPYLAPKFAGGGVKSECNDEAWDALQTLWLRPEKPAAAECVYELKKIAVERGWTLPSDRTLYRRLNAIDPATIALRRDGVQAVERMIPAQERDRSGLHAMEAVNADGHTWDVFVRWPGVKDPIRPVMTAFQDIYSGKFLSWRFDVSENWHQVRLAFGDMVERYGIPDRCLFDNGRHYASKKISGGTPNRFRFKAKEEEPKGILTALGVQIHWATPYHGQSKPIERGFGDFARRLAKHPRFAGAYTGNNPMAKPSNYGKTAVPLDVFIAVVNEGIADHNQRTGRTGGVCNGRSFEEVFSESLASVDAMGLRRYATAAQRQLWLLAAEAVSVDRKDGTVSLMGNRFWSRMLWPLRGKKVTVRFDPDHLQRPALIYRLNGAFLCEAECIEKTGFFDAEAAQTYARNKRALVRHIKATAAIENSMSLDHVTQMLPAIERAAPPPPPRVTRLVTGNLAMKPRVEEDADAGQDAVIAALRSMREARESHPHLSLVSPPPHAADE